MAKSYLRNVSNPARHRIALNERRIATLHTDMYQLTMFYGYWKNRVHNKQATFDLFFRKTPFGREYAVFGGLSDVMEYLTIFRFTESDIQYCQQLLPHAEPEFFDYLRTVDASEFEVYAIPEGSIVFPRVPLIRVVAPLGVAQFVETALLNLTNFPTLMATNAFRFRLLAGDRVKLSEFGLRRAQGPDGGLTASKYAYLGLFDSSSNVRAGQLYGIKVSGTHAHAFVQSFVSLEDLALTAQERMEDGTTHGEFLHLVQSVRHQLGFVDTNDGELAAFIAYAQAYPNGFLALVDTYDTEKSGIPNFLCVAVALARLGFKPLGIRLDSGDLAYLSKRGRSMFREIGERAGVDASSWIIVASNDIDEKALVSMNESGHEIDVFGIGTHLVTCLDQPAMGCVYKLVSIDGHDRIKLSQEREKITIPGRKVAFRLFDGKGIAVLDVMIEDGEEKPEVGKPFVCRHPFVDHKRSTVIPSVVEELHVLFWDRGKERFSFDLESGRQRLRDSFKEMREDHMRRINPTPYKVSVSEQLYARLHELWQKELPETVIQ